MFSSDSYVTFTVFRFNNRLFQTSLKNIRLLLHLIKSDITTVLDLRAMNFEPPHH